MQLPHAGHSYTFGRAPVAELLTVSLGQARERGSLVTVYSDSTQHSSKKDKL